MLQSCAHARTHCAAANYRIREADLNLFHRLLRNEPRPHPAGHEAICFPEATSRNNNLNFIRLALATGVILSHSFPLSRGASATEPLVTLTRQQLSLGSLAVDFFFVISGFLILQSWERSGSLWDYTKKRFLRIYPGLIGALAFCILIAAPLGGADWPRYLLRHSTASVISEALQHQYIMNMPGVFANNPQAGALNGSTWTIRYETGCYMLLALFGLLGLLRLRVFLPLFFVATLIGSVHFGDQWHAAFPLFGPLSSAARFACYFAAGMMFYRYRTRIPYSGLLAVISSVALALACLGGMAVALPIFGTYLLFYIGFSQRLNLHRFGMEHDLSYGSYLYAFPIQQILVHLSANRISPLLLFAAAVPLTYVIAFLSWTFIEKPCLKLKPKRKAAPAEGVPAIAAAPALRS